MYRVTVLWPGGGSEFDAASGGSMLDSGLAAGLHFSHSCKSGDCQACACFVVDGRFELVGGGLETPDGQHLMCQLLPRSPISVAIDYEPRQIGRQPKPFPAKVRSVNQVSKNVFELNLCLPPNFDFSFIGGQFVQLRTQGGVERSYSIASYSSETREIRFFIKKLPRGEFSQWLISAQPGEMVRVYGPCGQFVWREAFREKNLFIATGTGIVPIYALLQQFDFSAFNEGQTACLFWGNRVPEEVFLRSELESLCTRLGIKLSMVFSQDFGESPSKRVTDLLTEDMFYGAQAYVAGNPNMISDVRLCAKAGGLDFSDFHVDRFVSSKR